MKNIIKIDKQRLELALRFDNGDIPTDKEILDYISSDRNEFIECDTFKLLHQLVIRQGLHYERNKVMTEFGLEYPNEWIRRILNEISEYIDKVIKEHLRGAKFETITY